MRAVADPTVLGELELFQGLTPEELAELNGLLMSADTSLELRNLER